MNHVLFIVTNTQQFGALSLCKRLGRRRIREECLEETKTPGLIMPAAVFPSHDKHGALEELLQIIAADMGGALVTSLRIALKQECWTCLSAESESPEPNGDILAVRVPEHSLTKCVFPLGTQGVLLGRKESNRLLVAAQPFAPKELANVRFDSRFADYLVQALEWAGQS